MCLLAFYPETVMPVLDHLRNSAEVNTDGYGFAIVSENTLFVRKSMNPDELIEQFGQMRAEHPNGPALFHSRMATHGTVNLENCHPFEVGSDPFTVLAHNGILPAKVQPTKNDPRSDTRVAADDFFGNRKMGHWYTRRGISRYSNWMGTNNKICILTVNPKYSRNWYLFNENQGEWVQEGIWYSNSWYKPYTPWVPKMQKWYDYDKNDDECPICGANNAISEVMGMCRYCLSCVHCWLDATDCLCYDKSGIIDDMRNVIGNIDK